MLTVSSTIVTSPDGSRIDFDTSRSRAQARASVDVKLLEQAGELYILARSAGRVTTFDAPTALKEAIHATTRITAANTDPRPTSYQTGGGQERRRTCLVTIHVPAKDQAVRPETFTFSLNKKKLRIVRQREGHYLLRSNLGREHPATLWQYYLQLTEVEQAFKELKSDLSIRPIYHQKDTRIEAGSVVPMNVSPPRPIVPRGLPSTDVTRSQRYYAPSDFLTAVSASSL